MKRTIYPIILALLTINACTKENIVSNTDFDIPVVEAFLEPEQEILVKLSKMLPFTDDEYTEALSIDTAKVYINHNGVDYLLIPQSSVPGNYVNADSNLKIIPSNSYNISFNYNGKMVSANTTIPAKPVNTNLSSNTFWVDTNVMGPGSSTNPITIYWDNPDNNYHLAVIEYLESVYNPIQSNLSSDNFETFRRVSTSPVLETSFDLNTREHLAFFGSYRIIIYKVNEEYVNLYENISQSSLNLTEPLTNIDNGVGIFTGINSDTLLLQVSSQ